MELMILIVVRQLWGEVGSSPGEKPHNNMEVPGRSTRHSPLPPPPTVLSF